MGSMGLSRIKREERRLEVLERLSETLDRAAAEDGKGDLERDVERELWAE